ncbi:MAG TPA: SDR family oxidoreductase [Thermomicrobiales bacterium]|nr:SDR family oxidoreductase [Thermomicrobiales bacterium]
MSNNMDEIPGGGQVVVVTGASSGVGRAVARAFGERGARVGLLSRNEDALNAAAAEIRSAGGEALVCPTDVADSQAVERAAAQIEAQWGRIDVWVNCAMATVFAPVAEMTPDEYRRVTDVTYLGYVHGTLAALRRMRPRDQGTIVQIGSALAYRSIPLQSAYCAAKAAIRGFTDSLRTELIHEGSSVRITAVHLPAINTPQAIRQRNKMPRQSQPVPPMFDPEIIARQVVWASDHAPREMLVGTPTMKAVWAQKFIPGLLGRYLGKNGWDAQFTDEPNRQDGDILFETLPGDPGAHGPYRDREQGPDLQMRLRPHARSLAAAVGVGCVLAIKAIGRRA